MAKLVIAVVAALLTTTASADRLPPELEMLKLGLPIPVQYIRGEGLRPITMEECNVLQLGTKATFNTSSPPYTKWTRTCYYGGQSPRWVPRKLSKKVR